MLPIIAGGFDLLQNIQTSLIMKADSMNAITNFQILLANYTNQAKFIFIIISFILIVLGILKKFFIKN